MPEQAHLIRILDGVPRLAPDHWRVLDCATDWDLAPAGASLLLPLALAEAQAERVRADQGRTLGLTLAPDDDPARALPFFPHIALIGVQFPKFTDGRGYSTAVLLRLRHGWRGELRALGEVLQDQLFALRRVGFDSFALAAGRDPQAALRAFAPFSDTYQGSVDQRLPAFARTPRSMSADTPPVVGAPADAAAAVERLAHVQGALALLRAAADQQPAVFSTSYGAEDMVVLDLIRRHGLPIGTFTLDTGRLPEETYSLMRAVEERYGRCVDTLFPDARAVQDLVARNGINGFRDSVEKSQGVLRRAQARTAGPRARGQARLG